MTPPLNFGAVLAAWAARQPAITGLVLIGSRERAASDAVWRADPHSDWDFHVLTSRPQIFADSAWTKELAGARLQVYAPRMTRIGTVPKVNAIFAGTEVDLVIVPTQMLRAHRRRIAKEGRRLSPPMRQFLQDLSVVIRPGFRFLKDTGEWERFYRQAVRRGVDPRLDDVAAGKLADGFVCDYVWTLRKIARGELFAAQRMLHRELTETNYRLMHELRLRRGQRSFPEVRRLERVASPAERRRLAVESALSRRSLSAAAEKAARTCRELMRALAGTAWSWPEIDLGSYRSPRAQRRTRT